jgi:membrane-associated protease RseP (regulator of RpoE activity)
MSKWYILLFIIAISWLAIRELEKRGRLKAERHSLLLIFRTEKGKEFISRIARHKKFWSIFSSAAIVVGILGMVFVSYLIFKIVYSTYILKIPLEGGVQLVIPGITIPFWYGILGLITVLFVHEFAHGIVARSEDVALKSLGIVSVAAIPIGAFVEPDEEELKSKPRVSRLRVYSVGSFGNILLALLGVIALVSLSSTFFDISTLQITSVAEDSPADGVLEKGMVLKAINGIEISSNKDFAEAVKEIKPNQRVNIATDKGSFYVTTAAKKDAPGRGYIGIGVGNPLREGLPSYFYFSLNWIVILNLGIGLINLAPLHFGIAATDGHHILREILSKFIEEKSAEKVTIFVSTTMLLAIIFIVIPVPVP